jgi:hypothetical protein
VIEDLKKEYPGLVNILFNWSNKTRVKTTIWFFVNLTLPKFIKAIWNIYKLL